MWLDSDRAAALEWQAEQDLLCSGCGKPRDETMANERLVDEGVVPDYVVEKRRCRGCEALGAAHKEAAEAEGDPGSGMYHLLRETRLNGQEVS